MENSRSYIDELYSDDAYKCQEAIVCLKNAVIGSNKKKGSVISQGIVPRLIALLRDESKDYALRLDAAIVIGSLAKGTESQVHSLIYYETVQVLLGIVVNPGTDRRLMETCLGALKTVLQYPFAPIELLHSNIGNLQRLIQLASPSSSIQCQEYVANIFVPLCHSSHQQKNLCQANVIPFLARLMTTQLTVLQVPALKCLAAMCFTNKYVSDAVCQTCHEERSILDILTVLLSRTRDVQIQLSASRCLTYLHRSGSLRADDYRIVYKTLPSLARLCSEDFDEDTRATAAETLAYLAEVSSSFQALDCLSTKLDVFFFQDRLGAAAAGRHQQPSDLLAGEPDPVPVAAVPTGRVPLLRLAGRQRRGHPQADNRNGGPHGGGAERAEGHLSGGEGS